MAIRKMTVCSLWYWMISGGVLLRPYPVHITTWLVGYAAVCDGDGGKEGS
jgi:hypothetical protein